MSQRVSAAQVFRDPVHFLAFGFGTGLSPIAPGTIGSLVGVLIHGLFWYLGVVFELRVFLVVLITGFGIWLCGYSARKLGVHDHPGIVWDEIAGYLIAGLFVTDDFYWMLYAFVLFRIFDIVKPWPIRSVDRQMSGGLGIMLDDVLAGVFTGVILGFVQLIL